MITLDIVILAAGIGKRMRSSVPKVLHRLGGRPLLSHVINTARRLAPYQISVVIGHGGDLVQEAIAGKDINWVQQQVQLGTGHALLQALPHLSKEGRTLVLFGDVPLIQLTTLQNMITLARDKQCVLLTAQIDDSVGYGKIIRSSDTNEIMAIVEHKDADEKQIKLSEINSGIMLVSNACLHDWLPKLKSNNAQQEYYLTDLIAMAVGQGIKIDSLKVSNLWEVQGINDKRQLASLERIYQKNCTNELLDKGVGLADPNRIDVRGEINCGIDVEIDINCVIEGKVELGHRVKIGAHCILKNCKVAADTIIFPYSLIENAIIGESCRVGPYARIRPGTTLASNVQIGNFVEVKASSIAAGSKANHLSYIGDCSIGEKVNIGAGTITCNYDGVKKNHTIIEDNVFIGSGTQLVAPVRIAKGSIIGAGSTITKNTPEDALTLTRVKQTSFMNWKRPTKEKG